MSFRLLLPNVPGSAPDCRGHRSRESHRTVHLPQQQRADVAAEIAAAEIGHDLARTEGLKLERHLLDSLSQAGRGMESKFFVSYQPLQHVPRPVFNPRMIFPG